MSHTPKLLFAAVAALMVSACNSGSSALTRMIDADMATFISIDTAIETARAEVPDGIVVEVELEIEDDDENEPPAFEVVLFRKGANQLVEVEVHAVTGAVLEVEVEDDEDDDEDDD